MAAKKTSTPTPSDKCQKARPRKAVRTATARAELHEAQVVEAPTMPAPEAPPAGTPTPAEAPPLIGPGPPKTAEAPTVPVREPSPTVTAAPTQEQATASAEALLDRTPKTKKLSAVDAAIQVLAESGQAMTCRELIAAMAAKGYWTSPKGRTPAGTLYSAVLRELKTRGDQSRFRKTERGKFALRQNV